MSSFRVVLLTTFYLLLVIFFPIIPSVYCADFILNVKQNSNFFLSEQLYLYVWATAILYICFPAKLFALKCILRKIFYFVYSCVCTLPIDINQLNLNCMCNHYIAWNNKHANYVQSNTEIMSLIMNCTYNEFCLTWIR